jgi:excisionase family DNA binding protein
MDQITATDGLHAGEVMRFFTLQEAADYARVSYGTIRNACLEGRLRHARIGRTRGKGHYRIAASDLESFLQECVVELDTLVLANKFIKTVGGSRD